MRLLACGAATLVLCAIATPARAETGDARLPTGALSPVECQQVDVTHEADDERVVQDVLTEFGRGSYAALEPRLPALRDVMGHAPACFPGIEWRGEQIIVRMDGVGDSSAAIIIAVLTVAAARGRSASAVRGFNTYPIASFLLGAYANEMRQPDEAVRWLDMGLALQPHHPLLALEKTAALQLLQRPGDAAALLQSVLDDPDAPLFVDRARFLRNLGVSLIDADRLDDAEAALNESIRLQPNNPGARNELEYIAQLRAGAARRGLAPAPPWTPPK